MVEPPHLRLHHYWFGVHIPSGDAARCVEQVFHGSVDIHVENPELDR